MVVFLSHVASSSLTDGFLWQFKAYSQTAVMIFFWKAQVNMTSKLLFSIKYFAKKKNVVASWIMYSIIRMVITYLKLVQRSYLIYLKTPY